MRIFAFLFLLSLGVDASSSSLRGVQRRLSSNRERASNGRGGSATSATSKNGNRRDPALATAIDACGECTADGEGAGCPSDEQILICHNGESICVGPSAWLGHCLNHGDTCGSCDAGTDAPTTLAPTDDPAETDAPTETSATETPAETEAPTDSGECLPDGEGAGCSNPNQINICHDGRQLCVNQNAWGGHQGHGDTCGVCPTETAEPSTVDPSTAEPSTADPSTADPSTADPSTVDPSTAEPTTADPTTADPTTADPTTVSPTTASPFIDCSGTCDILCDGRRLQGNSGNNGNGNGGGNGNSGNNGNGNGGGNSDKIVVCHNGNELCISPNAWGGHCQHGDSCGTCSGAED